MFMLVVAQGRRVARRMLVCLCCNKRSNIPSELRSFDCVVFKPLQESKIGCLNSQRKNEVVMNEVARSCCH